MLSVRLRIFSRFLVSLSKSLRREGALAHVLAEVRGVRAAAAVADDEHEPARDVTLVDQVGELLHLGGVDAAEFAGDAVEELAGIERRAKHGFASRNALDGEEPADGTGKLLATFIPGYRNRVPVQWHMPRNPRTRLNFIHATRPDPRHRRPHRPRQDLARQGAHRHRLRPPARGEGPRHHHRHRLRHTSTCGDFRLGIVDVPGHERFIKNMLAGATGIDLALLVVAADDSVMPQTREHLEILKLLGLRHGVIALTKCDLVDETTREVVELEIRELVQGIVPRRRPDHRARRPHRARASPS